MKVLSMIQPWATLLALGHIKYETRTWRTKYRGPLAIHASKKTDKFAAKLELITLLLQKHGYTEKTLPNGVIIATCRLHDCFKVIEATDSSAKLDNGVVLTGIDFIFGDYREGNYAWELHDMKMLPTFIAAKGKLGLWEHPDILIKN